MNLLKPRKVAHKLGVTEGALAQMRYMRTGPSYVKVNSRNIMYRESDVDEWIESRTVQIQRDQS